MVRVGRDHFVAGGEMPDGRRRRPHRRADGRRQGVDGPGLVGADVVDLVPGLGALDARGDDGRDVVDVAERAHLFAVAEDRQRLSGEDLAHEDADHIAVGVADVLVFAVHVVRTEDHVVQTEHLAGLFQIELHRVLRDAVGIFRHRHERLDHRRLIASVHGDRAREHEALHRTGIHGRVHQVHAADEIVPVVEVLDEMRKPFRRIRRQVEDVGEARAGEQVVHQRGVLHAALHELGTCRDVLDEAARQVVEHDDAIARLHEPLRDMRSDESGTAGNQHVFHCPLLRPIRCCRGPCR